MDELLYIIYLLGVTERGAWIRTINTLLAHEMSPRQIVEFISQCAESEQSPRGI